MKNLFWLGCLDPESCSVGDHAQILAIEQVLREQFTDYRVKRFYRKDTAKFFGEKVQDEDLIFFQSSGDWGDFYFGWHETRKKILVSYPKNRVVQLPVSVCYRSVAAFEEDKVFFSDKPNFLLLCRTQVDAEVLGGNFGCQVRFFPDFAFNLKVPNCSFKRRGTLFVLRRDKEADFKIDFVTFKSVFIRRLRGALKRVGRLCGKDLVFVANHLLLDKVASSLTAQNYLRTHFHGATVKDVQVSSVPIYDANREGIVYDTLKLYFNFKCVVTDRFHACVFAYLTGTPYLSLPSLIKGKVTIPDLNYGEYFRNFRNVVFTSQQPKTVSFLATDILDVIRQRRSVRQWQSKTVSEDLINKIVEAGYYAPSAANSQCVKIKVVQTPSNLHAVLCNTSPWFKYSKPAFAVLVLYDLAKAKKRGLTEEWHKRFIWQDSACASMNMLLAVECLGLAGCWISFNPKQQKALMRFFGLKDCVLTNGVLCGYGGQTVDVNRAIHQGRPIKREIF